MNHGMGGRRAGRQGERGKKAAPVTPRPRHATPRHLCLPPPLTHSCALPHPPPLRTPCRLDQVPLVGAATVPHRVEAKFNAARCVVVPAADGTGVLAGSSIRSVLELAGVQNVLAKRIGCRSLLNNARCTVAALSQLQTLQEASKSRGVPIERLLLPRK